MTGKKANLITALIMIAFCLIVAAWLIWTGR